MRTRRSPRNQERLWRELGGRQNQATPAPIIRTDAEIDAMYWIPKRSREMMKQDQRKIKLNDFPLPRGSLGRGRRKSPRQKD